MDPKDLAELNRFTFPDPEMLIPRPPLVKSPAESAFERLGNMVKDFEADLDNEHEIGVGLVCFGVSTQFHIQNIGYWGPDIITFAGVNENGERVQLIQNVSQLSVLLVAMKKLGDKPRRIGFLWDDDPEVNSEAVPAPPGA